ncbi:hypothetical protein HanRHA438_Chr01g0000401 [Helianthus annuus]|nr:hypothetical protein HanIR_Chr01g0000461 [Helianthus annuus]KAJ0946111.1 hypothetical protein HanRHA438_Chr01g0000401 [Helianthus annuus]
MIVWKEKNIFLFEIQSNQSVEIGGGSNRLKWTGYVAGSWSDRLSGLIMRTLI